jgi:hypothetical protein
MKKVLLISVLTFAICAMCHVPVISGNTHKGGPVKTSIIRKRHEVSMTKKGADTLKKFNEKKR